MVIESPTKTSGEEVFTKKWMLSGKNMSTIPLLLNLLVSSISILYILHDISELFF